MPTISPTKPKKRPVSQSQSGDATSFFHSPDERMETSLLFLKPYGHPSNLSIDLLERAVQSVLQDADAVQHSIELADDGWRVWIHGEGLAALGFAGCGTSDERVNVGRGTGTVAPDVAAMGSIGVLARSIRDAALDHGVGVWIGFSGSYQGSSADGCRRLSCEALEYVAREGASVAEASGLDRVVHTELYELAQERYPASVPQDAAPQPEPPRAAADRREAPARSAENKPADIAVLRRRLAKLTRALEAAEAKLASRSLHSSPVEEGVASVFRSVQGIGRNDPQQEKKAGLMASIFQSNLALRQPEVSLRAAG